MWGRGDHGRPGSGGAEVTGGHEWAVGAQGTRAGTLEHQLPGRGEGDRDAGLAGTGAGRGRSGHGRCWGRRGEGEGARGGAPLATWGLSPAPWGPEAARCLQLPPRPPGL